MTNERRQWIAKGWLLGKRVVQGNSDPAVDDFAEAPRGRNERLGGSEYCPPGVDVAAWDARSRLLDALQQERPDLLAALYDEVFPMY